MTHDKMHFFECEGWWEQDWFGRQPMDGLQIGFDSYRLEGDGIDVVGPFKLEGLLGENGAVAIQKHYIGKHRVDYVGVFDGEGTISGEWRIGPLRGRWMITIRRAAGGQAREMVQLVPMNES